MTHDTLADFGGALTSETRSKLVGPIDVAGVRFWFPPPLHREAAIALARHALKGLEGSAREAKRGRVKALYTGLCWEGEEYLLKCNRYRERWSRRGTSKARRELARTLAIAGRGIPTVVPAAAGESRKWGALRWDLLILRRVPGGHDLGSCWRDGSLSYRQQAHWAKQWGKLAHRMHAVGVVQNDFAPNNFLATPEGLLAIDFERAGLRKALRREERLRQLAKLYRHLADASRPLGYRFALAYCGGQVAQARQLWRDVEAELPRLLRRDVSHLRRRAGRPGRRFAIHGAETSRATACWAWTRREFEGGRLAALLDALGPSPLEAGTWPWKEFWVRSLGGVPTSRRRLVWAATQALAQWRGLTPMAWALLFRGQRAYLVYDREPGASLWSQSDPTPDARAAVAVLERRLRSLGIGAATLPPDAVALRPATLRGPRAQLLEPRVFLSGTAR